MAQFGSAFGWGPKGRWFKSSRPDWTALTPEGRGAVLLAQAWLCKRRWVTRGVRTPKRLSSSKDEQVSSARGRTADVVGSRGFKVVGSLLLAGNLVFAGYLLTQASTGQGLLWTWLMTCATAVPVLACLARAVLGGPRRAGAIWLAVAMTAYLVGNVIFVGWTQYQVHPPVPSPADIAYLTVYPAAGAAVFCLLRRGGGPVDRGLWLDGALGAAGASTVLAAILGPALTSPTGSSGAVVVSAAFSVGDLLLVASVFGVLALRGVGVSSMWLWLTIGLATFCVADVVYALHVADGTFVVGAWWSVLWMVGLTIAAFAIWRPEQHRVTESGRSMAMLAVPALATMAALVVLIPLSLTEAPIAVGLGMLTLSLAAARTFVVFRLVRRLSDAHTQAVTDDLTGLGNRRALFEIGGRRLRAAGSVERVALLLIDLDDFKEVNDSLGHLAGDTLLCETARRLSNRVDRRGLLVRLGGDEFALVITLGSGEDGERSAERILDEISRPFTIEGAKVRVGASAGMAEMPSDQGSILELLRRADVAMYVAKATGARVELYDPKLDDDDRARLKMIHELDAALDEDQLLLHFQSKIDVATGAIVGAEALVRWQHPRLGLVYPDTFLPLVEQSGRMGALTRWVLRAAVQQIAAWRASGMAITIAVNLSASDLLDDHFHQRLLDLLEENAVPVEALELEITESVLMTEPRRAREVLGRLQRLGLRIAVDDYGTGYSALAYLRDLPVDELKIDRSFISQMSGDARSAAIVRSTIELGHALDLDVVAEGVEHEAALDTLVTFGCDYAQGYHFSRPIPAGAFARYVAAVEVDRLAVTAPLIAAAAD
ncbi:hypothetical protein BH10ACT11_BH10ACT11_06810 [soil metagenome]